MAAYVLMLLSLLLSFFFFRVTASSTNVMSKAQLLISTTSDRTAAQLQSILNCLAQYCPQSCHFKLGVWEMVKVTAICGVLPGFWFIQRKLRRKESETPSTYPLHSGAYPEDTTTDAEATDPGLLKKHSEFKSYTTTRFTYPNIRVFYRRHPQADKLPTEPSPLPLLVFVHGLGGSVAQFNPLLTSLVNLASCLSIDLPGCGLSSFEPRSWDAYKTEALAELVAMIIEDYREDAGQGVVLIGHSMGCSLATMIASRTSPQPSSFIDHIVGFVAICPKADSPSEHQVATFRKLLMIPGPIFDLWRMWDRRGGPESASVKRFVGPEADIETRLLQVRFNKQSRTPVWRRIAAGSLPEYQNGIPHGGLPGKEIWAGLEIPIFLVAGEMDTVTGPGEVEKIASFLGKSHPRELDDEKSEPITDAAAPVNLSSDDSDASDRRLNIESIREEDFDEKELPTDPEDTHEDPSTPQEELSIIPSQPVHPKKVLKTTVIPSPASHALLYMPTQVRILAGLVSDFLESQVSPRLSLGWQLQFLSTAGKWDVKNLAKWQSVAPVSEPIAGIFRAMKTLREVDETHCPLVFVKTWGNQIKDIIDISHESPVYDPRGLENGGIHYHKFPTVSKIPPTGSEVKEFIALVDRLREEQKARAGVEKWAEHAYIAVHCHYGFNRTGYFIVCYLVERCGYTVQGALDEFAKKRPKGIKHAHFMDQLFVRYCVGLKRAPTM